MNDKIAPDFTLSDVRGGVVTLSDVLKHQKVVLVFYRGSWCPICNVQLSELSAVYKKFQDLNVEIIAISNEPVKDGQKLLKKTGHAFPILYDAGSKVISQYNLVVNKRDPLGLILRKHDYAHPAVFLVGKDRKIQWSYKGETYKDRPAPETILQAIQTHA